MLRSQEFANQLCVLCEGLPADHNHPDCVSKWLPTLLMNDKSAACLDFPHITKKIRDEILGESKTNFFRRSSFYMSVKAILQHSLTLHLGAGAGKVLYKIIMLNFLADQCAPYTECNQFDIDLLSQMIAKLARRIEKLAAMTVEDKMTKVFNEVNGKGK